LNIQIQFLKDRTITEAFAQITQPKKSGHGKITASRITGRG
jgi:hypothetical protein